jgi:hypothetical protein
MSAMSSDLAQPPEQPARDGEPVLVSALVAAAVVTVFLIFDHWWSLHGIPTVLRWWGSAPFDAYIFIVSMVPAALLAVVLAIWGIDGRHRLAGALGALAAGLVDWASKRCSSTPSSTRTIRVNRRWSPTTGWSRC